MRRQAPPPYPVGGHLDAEGGSADEGVDTLTALTGWLSVGAGRGSRPLSIARGVDGLGWEVGLWLEGLSLGEVRSFST